MFFYYSNQGIPAGRFRARAQWQGDVSRWDGSIQLRNVQVNDSGTYVCEIRLVQCSTIFKNRTVLRVSPTAQRGACPVTAPLSRCPVRPHAEGLPLRPPCLGVSPAGREAASAQDSVAPGGSAFWPVTVGCGCVAVVLAFLAGLSLRKRYQR